MADVHQRLRTRFTQEPVSYADRNLLIVALGDSVTQGMAIDPEVIGAEVYHEVFRRQLNERYRTRTISMVNAGVAGDNTAGALARLQRDVLDHHPDLVTVCFGLNDSGGGKDGESLFRNNLTEILNRIRAVDAVVILLTPNMLAAHDNPRVPDQWKPQIGGFVSRQVDGVLGRYVDIIRQVASATGVPLADVYAEWMRREHAGKDMTELLANGLNHPDARGHLIFANALYKTFNEFAMQGCNKLNRK